MKELTLSNNLIIAAKPDDLRLRRTQSRWMTVLVLSAVLGVLSGLGGFVLSTAPWFFSDIAKGFSEAGTMLTVAFFPLLVFIAHSLDKIREGEKALKLAECRRSGLKDENC